MLRFESLAQEKGELSALTTEANDDGHPHGRIIDLLLPVAVLIAACTAAMIYVGGFFGTDINGSTQFAGDLIGSFGNTIASVSLPWGGLIALLFTVIYLLARRVVSFKSAMACIPKGFQAMIAPIIVLTLAVALKNTLNALDASGFVAGAMKAASNSLYSMLPAVILPWPAASPLPPAPRGAPLAFSFLL